MPDFTNILFKPFSLVIIRLNDEETIQGTTVATEDGSVQILKPDGTKVIIDQELLSRASFCYTGFPTVQEKEVPLTVKGNGTIYELNQTVLGVGRCLINSSSFVDPRLIEKEKEGCLIGTEVLHIVYKKGNNKSANVAAIIKAGPLDEVLDTISLLARQGRIVLAQGFCELVLEQFPEDDDALSFSMAIDEAVEKAKGVDFYSSLPIVNDDELMPYGRIYGKEEKGYVIVDTDSHEKLFCHNMQLYGDLCSMSSEELIGIPVVYSVKRNDEEKGGYKYQARTVLPVMSYIMAGELAHELFFNSMQKVSACDILRLILEQFQDRRYQRQLDSWSNNFSVKGKLWETIVLDEYSGPSESLYLPVPDIADSLSICRKETHMRVVSNLTGTPDVPIILTQEEMAQMKAEVAKAVELKASLEENDEESMMVSSEQEPSRQTSLLPDLTECPNANEMIKSKATITIRYRDGSLFVEGDSKPFSFSIEDIIDEDLKERAYVYSTKFIQNEPVVCQLWYEGHKATHICPPKSVLSMLETAKKAIVSAREKDPIRDRGRIYELYDAADGYVSHVLDAIPNHNIAVILKKITEEALTKFSNSCYKAPSNAIKPCGSIISLTKNKQSYRIKDPLFSGPVYLPISSIIDRSYGKKRPGDELVYSVYPGINKVPEAHFACLARTALDLIEMAEQWEKEENYTNAWGIAMNVLDAEPNRLDAQAIVKRCEPHVDVDTVQKRQKLLRENLFAQAQIATAEENYEKAIKLFTRIIDNDDNNVSLKEQSVLRLLHIYNVLQSINPNDNNLRMEYKRAGEKYALGRHGAKYYLEGNTLDGIDAIINFYEDMEDSVELVNVYQRKLQLISDGSIILDDEKKMALQAETNAYISWYILLSGGNTDDAARFAARARIDKDDKEPIELGRKCLAVVQMRRGDNERVARENGRFLQQNIDPFESMFAIQAAANVYSGEGEMRNLTYERFALLGAILQEKRDPQQRRYLLHYLGRYLATLTENETDYREYVSTFRINPDDCNFVNQVYKCLIKGPAQPLWMDIRLVCMLSQEAAYKLCSTLYDLDAKTIASVLTRSKVETRPNPERAYFSRQFAQWRGGTFRALYVSFLKKVDALENEPTLDNFMEFFRELEYDYWMSHDDKALIEEFHTQLPLLLASFNRADNSRAIKSTSKAIESNVNMWRGIINDRPTLLMKCAFDRALLQVRNTVLEIERNHHFSEPIPIINELSYSAIDNNGSMYAEVEIRNKDKNAEPMLECKLQLCQSDYIIPDILASVVTYSETEKVYGDESIIYILHFSINREAIPEDLHALLHFEYKVKSTTYEKDFKIRIKPLKKYKRIINDFNVGSVETERFYGREALIENAVYALTKKTSVPPHYFIYGQKRSGKSSVLIQIENHIMERRPSTIIVDIDFSQLKILKEENVYYWIFMHIAQSIENINDEILNEEMMLGGDVLTPPSSEEMTYEAFVLRLSKLKAQMNKKAEWADRQLVLFIDEFTTAYTWLKAGTIGKEFVFRWKNLQKRGLLAAVLIGQDVLHAFIRECDSENAFEVLEKERLTYLKPEEARQMITDRLTEVTGKREGEIFVGKALSKILYYSASSAYYTKWICQQLVDYLNSRQLNKITEADVDAAVWGMIRNQSDADIEEKFDALLLPGIRGESRFSKERTKSVLDYLVDEELQNPFRGCSRTTLLARSGEKDAIINDLLEREVILDPTKNGFYFINVKLYCIWFKVRNNLRK